MKRQLQEAQNQIQLLMTTDVGNSGDENGTSPTELQKMGTIIISGYIIILLYQLFLQKMGVQM